MPKTIALGLSHPGTVRNRNENAFFLVDTLVPGEPEGPAVHAVHADQPVQFYAVAAGIGGHGIGDAAARAALDALRSTSRKVCQPSCFDFFAFGRTYLQQADRAVRKVLRNRPGVYAGASLALLCLAGESAYVLSSGDCRCYCLRGGTLERLTDDDARSETPPHRLTSFLGQLGEDRPDQPRLRQYPLAAGDIFLLTTRGLTDLISDDRLEERLGAPGIFTAKPEHLLRQALARDARDNLSFVMLRVTEAVPADAEPTPEPEHPRHRIQPRGKLASHSVRTGLILLASIAFGFLAGWFLLSMIF